MKIAVPKKQQQQQKKQQKRQRQQDEEEIDAEVNVEAKKATKKSGATQVVSKLYLHQYFGKIENFSYSPFWSPRSKPRRSKSATTSRYPRTRRSRHATSRRQSARSSSSARFLHFETAYYPFSINTFALQPKKAKHARKESAVSAAQKVLKSIDERKLNGTAVAADDEQQLAEQQEVLSSIA